MKTNTLRNLIGASAATLAFTATTAKADVIPAVVCTTGLNTCWIENVSTFNRAALQCFHFGGTPTFIKRNSSNNYRWGFCG